MNNCCKTQSNIEKLLRTNRFRFRNICVAVLIAVATMITSKNPLAEEKERIARVISFEGIRNKQFCEILVVKEDGVDVYNTAVNECREAAWNRLNLENIRQQLGAKAVQKNGPYFWMMDSQNLSLELLDLKVTIADLDFRWMAMLDSSILATMGNGAEPYKVFTPKKTLPIQKIMYARQKPVFELIDPDGHIYVLQARHEKFPIESLATLGDRMKKLPDGWQYRTRTLTENMVLDLGKDKPIFTVGDEFHQYYTRIAESR